jgi:hypothetical protein
MAKAKGKCHLMCCAVPPEVVERIRQSVAEGRGRSMFDIDSHKHAAMCRCGVPRKPPGIMKLVNDDGLCVVHPDKPPQRWTRGAGRGEEDSDSPD